MHVCMHRAAPAPFFSSTVASEAAEARSSRSAGGFGEAAGGGGCGLPGRRPPKPTGRYEPWSKPLIWDYLGSFVRGLLCFEGTLSLA